MGEERQIWLGRGQEKFGPYAESLIHQWLAERKVSPSMLAWVDGMAEWRPVYEVLGLAPGTVPPLPPDAFGGLAAHDSAIRALPAPPSLHWFLVFLLCIPTLGIMGIVWPFVQASWVRKIDPSSKATGWLIASVVLTLASFAFGFTGLIADPRAGMPSTPLVMSQLLIGLARVACLMTAMFSMARSMRRVLPRLGLVPDIGGITLFFFTTFYLQGQMSWVARWRETGQIDPPAPKALFWVLWFVPALVILIVAVALMTALHHG